MIKKSAVRIFSGESTRDLEGEIEFVLNKNNGFYIQSISISYVEGRFYTAVVFNTEQSKNTK